MWSRDNKRVLIVVLVGVVVVAAAAVGTMLALRAQTPAAEPTPSATAEPTPSPTSTEIPADTEFYDASGMPIVDVFAVVPELSVDTHPEAELSGELATPKAPGAVVFATPGAEPVALLPDALPYGGTTVPVIQKLENWVQVMLPGRAGLPSAGVHGQLVGWLRMGDVTLSSTDTSVVVDMSDLTVDIITAGTAERVATDFGWGTDATPTPIGRTFIMTTQAYEQLSYTRGHPLVYFGVHSPTLDDFEDQGAAVTAFHYHDAHSGAISNGCIRLDEQAITRLAQLPMGTPVIIRE